MTLNPLDTYASMHQLGLGRSRKWTTSTRCSIKAWLIAAVFSRPNPRHVAPISSNNQTIKQAYVFVVHRRFLRSRGISDRPVHHTWSSFPSRQDRTTTHASGDIIILFRKAGHMQNAFLRQTAPPTSPFVPHEGALLKELLHRNRTDRFTDGVAVFSRLSCRHLHAKSPPFLPTEHALLRCTHRKYTCPYPLR